MATTPYFLWPPHSSNGGPDSDIAGFSPGALETALAPAMTTAADTSLVSPERGTAAAARPRLRRNSSGSGKQQQQPSGGGPKKAPQRGLGVAELERLRCGGDPLRELGLGVVSLGDAGAQVHPLLHCNHHHHQVPAPTFDAVGARYCSTLLAQAPPTTRPQPAGPGGYVHHPPAAGGGQRAPYMAPEQQYFMDRLGRMGGFSPASNCAGADHQTLLLPSAPSPEHPSSQSTIWRPAESSSSCLQSGHRCDLCSTRMMRALGERGAPGPRAPPSPTATATNMPDYSVYDLAADMATARQGEAFLARERKREVVIEAPAKEEVIEIEFFPAAGTHHAGGTGPDESEFVASMSSSYAAGSCAAASLDLSLRL